ncbi:sigma-70 family RNA polymerase sigma factor [Citromicrobium bathyomarinum]|jgi:RNA polymerase sigma factor (sigma-70 family)|uniref:Sigma-70 family RNA polymerase sigma factor n=1 Tax=Alteriqipengyuania abyssalis TaxID=2860200 RepID=A0ABS7PCL3_9SPHN|nr:MULTISPECIES: sigma-70 family RNA polymerase sigma factor [Sphingomonadales]MAO05499.1 RNA polymerase subunit sigma-70 [Citromicrobium sp.]ALG60095.1 RNA polymerase sigma70 [Citromicrobium sp. JL477]KPM17523.1 RNA polymerase sigma70 [Citromicrobium sp. JL31]KPM18764.1 RNA polymerase sigma70 [Citromicrobium sp. JL1351]KPM22060.1 RNA polymerase sigma70 [Citromicrobium sp. RCC1885]|tara:strand:+ start:784 stop:1404 length:621 start_codon:yes stop_codon:yes gene_type:complete
MSGHPAPAADPVEFKRELTGVVPHLRAFARGLCGRPDMADDLVQETLMKAWAAQERFEPGTSMRAWTFVILRNAYLTDMRRNRFRGEYDENVAERILTAPAGQEEPIHLSDMHRALLTLPPERREALLLVGAGGFSYEEAANICGCAVGTIKSRVGRARAALNAMLADGDIPRRSIDDDTAHRAILEELDDVAAGNGLAEPTNGRS